MQVDDAARGGTVFILKDKQGGDGVMFHDLQRGRRQLMTFDPQGVELHEFRGLLPEDVETFLQRPAQLHQQRLRRSLPAPWR